MQHSKTIKEHKSKGLDTEDAEIDDQTVKFDLKQNVSFNYSDNELEEED